MSLRLSGTTKTDLQRLWHADQTPLATTNTSRYDQRPALFTAEQVLAYAVGNPSEGCSDRYQIFDEGTGRIIARLPGPPFLFVDRITDIRDCQQWQLQAGGSITAQYDVPVDAWYFAADRSATMPFAVLLETPCNQRLVCGVSWLGINLEVDIKFRSLGGQEAAAPQYRSRCRHLDNNGEDDASLTIGGMIIQHYHMEMRDSLGVVYDGTTYFGFLPPMLANQVPVSATLMFISQPPMKERARLATPTITLRSQLQRRMLMKNGAC